MEKIDSLTLESASRGSVVAISIALIWLAVAFLKSDRFPIDIPPKVRAPLAVALGQLLAVLGAVQSGVSWPAAAIAGLVASSGAVTFQEILGALRGLKPPTPPPGLLIVLCLIGSGGCAGSWRDQLASGLNGANQAIEVATPQIEIRYEIDRKACAGNAECEQKAKDIFNAYATGANAFRVLFCALSETGEGCFDD